MNDLDDLFKIREQGLQGRFPGHHRAVVVETNDPLNMGRIRFKCPELHDNNLTPEECPWAVPAFSLGGPNAGHFTHPCIGDYVWIVFEKDHPYGPIWVGFANPTRLSHFVNAQATQRPLTEANRNPKKPLWGVVVSDFLPLDGRPMSTGTQDRYGNLDIMSSVGFYPRSHDKLPPNPEFDPVTNTQLEAKGLPGNNNPDLKYMAKVTKYGNYLILGDQGYHWQKAFNPEFKAGEFTGDLADDSEFEVKRWSYLRRVLNEGQHKDNDQRRVGLHTRYGHKIEARDVGWAQIGPKLSTSRADEYGPARLLSTEEKADQRWIKLRTKGGMLFQAYDKGFDPGVDTYIQRTALMDAGFGSEKEDKHWASKDARWMRLVTRWGIKLVLDDRGSSDHKAETQDHPRGNGILMKGRRSPASKAAPTAGDPRGFFWQINENDELNHTMWGSPLGQTVELNDRYQYMMLAASMGPTWSPKWRGIKENEFCRRPMMAKNPEKTSHHLKLDHDNDYIRLKTRAGRGPQAHLVVNPSGVGEEEINQGFEARDGKLGDGPWVELVDCQHRGMWFSKTHQIGVWRGKKQKKLFQWMDDAGRKIAIYNGEESGKIYVYARGEVNIIANSNVTIQSDRVINIRAANSITLNAGNSKLTLAENITTNVPIHAPLVVARFPGVMPGIGAGVGRTGGLSIKRMTRPELPEVLEPTDRAKTYNSPFEDCPAEEIEHPITNAS